MSSLGHPLLDESSESKIDINQIFEKNKALIQFFQEVEHLKSIS